MKIDPNKLSKNVLGSARMSVGAYDENDNSRDDEIAYMSELEVFDSFLYWNGIIGLSGSIWEAVHNIKDASS